MRLALKSLALLLGGLQLCTLAQDRGAAVLQTATGKRQAYGTVRALLIGINRYDKLHADLNFGRADARGLAKELVDDYGYSNTNVKILTDPEATLSTIRDALNDLTDPASVKPEDLVLIYFSGHGHTSHLPQGGVAGYWIPCDGQIDKANPDNQATLRRIVPWND